jgi:hypothetical protein
MGSPAGTTQKCELNHVPARASRSSQATERPRAKFRRGARLVVVFEKARQLVLVIEPGEQMTTNRRGMTLPQPVVKPLIVAVSKALLLQGPFEIPIDFRHEGKVRVLRMHARDRLWPEWFRRHSPGALKNLWQQ